MKYTNSIPMPLKIDKLIRWIKYIYIVKETSQYRFYQNIETSKFKLYVSSTVYFHSLMQNK